MKVFIGLVLLLAVTTLSSALFVSISILWH